MRKSLTNLAEILNAERCKSVQVLKISLRAFKRIFTCKFRLRYSREQARIRIWDTIDIRIPHRRPGLPPSSASTRAQTSARTSGAAKKQAARRSCFRCRRFPSSSSQANLANLANFKFLQIFGGLVLGCIKTKFCKKIISKYSFDSIFQALQDLHTFAPLQSQNFRKKSV